MIIVWKGWGIVVPVIIGFSIVVSCAFAKLMGFSQVLVQNTAWIFAIGLCLAGFLNSLLGKKLNYDVITVKDEFGRDVKKAFSHNENTFFWIPLQHWSWVCFGLSLLSVYIALT